MNILSAHKYHTPRNGPPTPEQAEVRRIAYALKEPACAQFDLDTAATAMARLITGPCWLVPVPNRTGNADANAKLASAIARQVPGAQTVRALVRTQPIQSQCARHKLALGPTPPEEHHIRRTAKMLTLRQLYFVDNVTTSGNTLQACRDAFGCGAGLVWADAADRHTQAQADLL